MKTFLYTYLCDDNYYSLDIIANSREEAERRVKAIQYNCQYTGELKATLTVGMGWLARLICWVKS